MYNEQPIDTRISFGMDGATKPAQKPFSKRIVLSHFGSVNKKLPPFTGISGLIKISKLRIL